MIKQYSKCVLLVWVSILCFWVTSCRDIKVPPKPTHVSPSLTPGENFYFIEGGGLFRHENIAIGTAGTNFEEYVEDGVAKKRLVMTILLSIDDKSTRIEDVHVGQIIEFNGYIIRIIEIISGTQFWSRYLGFTILNQ